MKRVDQKKHLKIFKEMFGVVKLLFEIMWIALCNVYAFLIC